MPVGKLQRSSIKDLEISPPSATKKIVWDTVIKGFGAYKTSSGVVSFLFQYRMPGGKTKSTKLGNHGELTIEQARDMAAELAVQRRRGIDPISERKRLAQLERDKRDLVLSVYAEDYIQRRIEDDAPLANAPMTVIRRDVIGLLGHLRIDKMTIDDVETFGRKLKERGPSAKRSGLVQLKAILNDAVDRDRIAKSPARNVTTPKSGERVRRLREDETQRYLEACHDLGGVRGDLAAIYLRLVKRKDQEIANMTWEQLDIGRATWSIPDTNSKNNEPYVVELPRQVLEIVLRQQPDPKLRRGRVFTLDGVSAPVMGTDVKRIIDAHMHRRLELANGRDGTALSIEHFTLYDIRTTAASRLEEKPFLTPMSVLDAILLHKKDGRGSTKIYARAKLGTEAGEVLQVWNDHLDELMSRSDAWPGGMELEDMKPKERARRVKALRTGWPMREDQKKAEKRLEDAGIDTEECRRRQRRARIAAKKAGRTDVDKGCRRGTTSDAASEELRNGRVEAESPRGGKKCPLPSTTTRVRNIPMS